MAEASSAARFVLFAPSHLAVLLGTALAAAALIGNRRRLQAFDDRGLRRLVGSILVGNELLSWPIALAQGHGRVPLQLCDLALVLTAWGLLSRRSWVSELAYFWGLSGSLQAVLTPDLQEPFPTYWWMKFFIGHCGIVLSVVYLAVTGRVRPTHRSIWRVWAWTNFYALAAGLINWRWNLNLGYLAHKPVHSSLLDYFGPWPHYIIGLEIAALASFYLYYVPFVIGRRLGPRAVSAT